MKDVVNRSLRQLSFFCFLSLAVAVAGGQTPRPAPAGTLEDLQVPAPSLAGNLLGDPVTQRVFVYLPPSYQRESSRRYPSLYLLHGYSDKPETWGMKLPTEMNVLIAKGVGAEMIVVVPNGRNAYLGSFYTNSTVNGNWEDYVYRDVVRYIDGKYRTINKPSARGIAGHSMGGYGAFMLAMKHPDVFGATYALSPCCLGLEGDLSADNLVWGKAGKITTRDFSAGSLSFDDFFSVAMIAISAAFSPNKDRLPLYVDFPYVQKGMMLEKNEPAFSSFERKCRSIRSSVSR